MRRRRRRGPRAGPRSDELSERLDLVYAAKTGGELETLFGDLPAPAVSAFPAWRDLVLRFSRRLVADPSRRLVAVPAVAGTVALAGTTDPHLLWLAWPALAVLGRHHGLRRKWLSVRG